MTILILYSITVIISILLYVTALRDKVKKPYCDITFGEVIFMAFICFIPIVNILSTLIIKYEDSFDGFDKWLNTKIKEDK